MAATAYTESATLLGTALPKVRNASHEQPFFGDIALVVFLLAQCFDGIFTYVGVLVYGLGIEGNPIVGLLMTHLGAGVGVLSAKVIAGSLGIVLHLLQVHFAVAALAVFYVGAALTPWALILFF
jgi:hypothetical protein